MDYFTVRPLFLYILVLQRLKNLNLYSCIRKNFSAKWKNKSCVLNIFVNATISLLFLPAYDDIKGSYGFKNLLILYSFPLLGSVINANSYFKVTFLVTIYKHNIWDNKNLYFLFQYLHHFYFSYLIALARLSKQY